MSLPHLSSRNQTERVIGVARVALAASGLFAVWLDPSEPARFTALTYGLHAVYLFYSLMVLTALLLSRVTGPREPMFTHVVDIILSAVFQYLTFGPSSPFFVYFIFSVFCGALRWGWRGTLATATVVVLAYLGMAASMSGTIGPLEFEINRFIIRTVYLVVSAAILVYLGLHEERLRDEIERLAHWPVAAGGDIDLTARQNLAHAAEIVKAGLAAVVWERIEEPSLYLATWPEGKSPVTKQPPADLEPFVAEHLDQATFVSSDDLRSRPTLIVSDGAGTRMDHRSPALHPGIHRHVDGRGLASAPFATGRISGRVFFSNLGSPTAEIIPLTAVVARELGAALDQLHLTRQLQEIAASEERIRVARDLHDGVLQSLTGIRLEIRSLAGIGGIVDRIRDRLFAIERAIAIEQRELRLFIADLGPRSASHADTPLTARLYELRERISLQWKAPVTINVTQSGPIPEPIEQAVPLMVHEAIVNALKHGQPSRVAVSVDSAPHKLRIVVVDDGRGFPFRGRVDHTALVEGRVGPRSLLDRVVELGGEMSIESSDTGARVEMLLTL